MAFMSLHEIILVSCFVLYKKWELVQEFLASNINPAVVISTVKVSACLFPLFQVVRYVWNLQQESTSSDQFPVKPLFFPCRTSHVRMFPKKHGFAYSYLWVGIPIGWRGSVGGMIREQMGKDFAPWWKRWFSLAREEAWYSVNGDDYLKRGHVDGGLQGKLEEYLESRGVDHTKYAYAYLLTAARLFGYASNPVSVWHLYSPTKELKALVLEVNNTFDERRMYFLEPSQSGQIIEQDEVPKSTRYTETWPKDFYVSTFNSRSGAYSIAAYDPLSPSMSRTGPVNITITLSAEDHAMLIARIYSSALAIDPENMTTWGKTRFLASWWWVGLVTFPRTVHQALTLLLKKKMAWVFRPEPRQTTMPRHASDAELFFEAQFRQWLRSIVESAEDGLTVRYLSAGLAPPFDKEEIMTSKLTKDSLLDTPALDIRVLTPLFYTRLVQYPNLLAALINEHTLNGTLALSAPEALPNFKHSTLLKEFSLPFRDKINISLIKKLRRDPGLIAKLSGEGLIAVNDVMPRRASDEMVSLTELDKFVISNASSSTRQEYLSRTTKLLLAEHLAYGSMELLNLSIFLAKAGAFWVLMHRLF